jgi:hypothetical protein
MGSRQNCQTKPKYGLLQLPSVLDIWLQRWNRQAARSVPEACEWLWIAGNTTVSAHGKCLASQELRADLGFLLTEGGPYGLRKAALRFFDSFSQHAAGSRCTSSGVVLLPQVRLLAFISWLEGIRPIATRSGPHVYLRASWTKANLPRGRVAKPEGLSKEKVAGSPKGD